MTIFGVEFSTFDASIFDTVTHTDHRHCSLRGSARHVGAVVSLSSLTDLNGQQGMGYCSFKGAQQKTTFLEKNW